MAEFGAPFSREAQTDALAAVHAALGMRQALQQLREQLKAEQKPLIFHGIGIHFGAVVAGHLGSPDRIEYTVIGDAVNVAARIEGLTKLVKHDIVISDTVQHLIKDTIWTEDLGLFEVKGRLDPVHLYGVVDVREGDGSLYKQVQEDYQAWLSGSADRLGPEQLLVESKPRIEPTLVDKNSCISIPVKICTAESNFKILSTVLHSNHLEIA